MNTLHFYFDVKKKRKQPMRKNKKTVWKWYTPDTSNLSQVDQVDNTNSK